MDVELGHGAAGGDGAREGAALGDLDRDHGQAEGGEGLAGGGDLRRAGRALVEHQGGRHAGGAHDLDGAADRGQVEHGGPAGDEHRIRGAGDLRGLGAGVGRAVDDQQADAAQVVGSAGAGNTSAARAIGEAYRDQGYEVPGAALAGKAAEGLRKEAGIPARILASLEYGWLRDRDALHPGSVLVIDEPATRLSSAIERHLQLENIKARALQDAGRVGATMGQIQVQLRRVSATLQHVRAATGPAEKALAHVAERLGRAAVHTAISLRPKPL